MAEVVAKEGKELYDKGENKRALKDAMNFLKLGVNEEIVAQGTGLSIEKI